MEWKMPSDTIPSLKTLPQRSATQVTNRWAYVVRDVRKLGSVAITQHNQVEMVVMDAETYQKISAHAEEVRARSEAGLAELSDDFDRRLASLKADGIRDRVEKVMSARGRIKRPAKAGDTY
jgi:PHD/YefM family antitoxin component YafN of YafNO toxin-antitoxin module